MVPYDQFQGHIIKEIIKLNLRVRLTNDRLHSKNACCVNLQSLFTPSDCACKHSLGLWPY